MSDKVFVASEVVSVAVVSVVSLVVDVGVDVAAGDVVEATDAVLALDGDTTPVVEAVVSCVEFPALDVVD